MRLRAKALLLVAALATSCGPDGPAVTLPGDPDTDLANLFSYSPGPLEIRTNAVMTDDRVEVADMSYAGHGENRIDAYLVAPMGEGPFPAVVLMHWGGGSRDQFLEEAEALAAAGFVSLLVDADWQPERAHFIDTVIALRRGVDLLAARSDVDDARLGYVGHSWGASFGVILAAIDRRFATYILMAGVPSLAEFLDQPELEVFDAAPYLAAMPPSPMLFQAAESDENVTREVTRRFYELAGEPKSIEWYATTHRFANQDAADARAAWLQEHLGRG